MAALGLPSPLQDEDGDELGLVVGKIRDHAHETGLPVRGACSGARLAPSSFEITGRMVLLDGEALCLTPLTPLLAASHHHLPVVNVYKQRIREGREGLIGRTVTL